MAAHEKVFGNVMLGLIAGMIAWAVLGGLFGMLFRDNLQIAGHHGGRGYSDAYVDNGY